MDHIEYLKMIGRNGGKTVTPKKLAHLELIRKFKRKKKVKVVSINKDALKIVK